MTAWSLRLGLPNDLDEILRIERQTPDAPHWPQSIYESLLSLSEGDQLLRRRIFVASAAGQVTGFSVGSAAGGASGEQAPRQGELETVAVASEFRRLGIGRALCQAVVDWCREVGVAEITLEVRSRSVAPIALYQELGFQGIGRRPRYYAAPEDDALLMRLPLGSPAAGEAYPRRRTKLTSAR